MLITYRNEYEKWCSDPYFDRETQEELKALEGNDQEIQDRFYKNLDFGTGGLRGVIGAGTNRLNVYTVRKATQGLANFIIKEGGQTKGVAIAYDSRRMSTEFAREAALCLNANGIKTYVFDSLRPTPELSFALRTLGCVAGIVITASHNPPEYNGYKVYWEDGAQITAPKDVQIIQEVNEVKDYSNMLTMDYDDAVNQGLYHTIGEEIDNQYMEALKKLVLNPDIVVEQGESLKIVYTPLHGTGNLSVQRILKEIGFKKVLVVPEQELPDGNFPTVNYPNPEDPNAFTMALALAKKEDADLVLATDPDADRLGIYAKDSESGNYMEFTGNMSGLLICEYLLEVQKERGILPQNGAIVTTIVSSNMAKAIAEEYKTEFIETLTGFKFIGEQIKLFEENKYFEYLFGFEESYGCLIGTHARDKDAVVAVMSLCEAAAYYQSKGLTLWDQMLRIYEKYGYYKEGLHTTTLKGMDGSKQIEQIIEGIRENPPKTIGKYKVKEFRDYKTGKKLIMEAGQEEPTGLPNSNVLYFDLEDNGWCCIRPSGTEPKIKYYFGVKGSNFEDAENNMMDLKNAVLNLNQ